MQSSPQKGSAALWAIFLVVIIGVIIAAIMYGKKNETSLSPTELSATQAEILTITDQDNILGEITAPVVLIEYSDFQCPACANAAPIIKDALAEFDPSEVAFVYRHLPLRQIHPNADIAARAAQAAGEQGAFFAMHDLLFENQQAWSSERNPRDTFVSYAETLELDIDQFANDLNADNVRSIVNEQYAQAEVLLGGRLATPTLFLNGTQLSGSQLGNLANTIQEELDQLAAEPVVGEDAIEEATTPSSE
jgi:protein-disulfide isomerase